MSVDDIREVEDDHEYQHRSHKVRPNINTLIVHREQTAQYPLYIVIDAVSSLNVLIEFHELRCLFLLADVAL